MGQTKSLAVVASPLFYASLGVKRAISLLKSGLSQDELATASEKWLKHCLPSMYFA
jgi:hypothetical protein